MKPQQKRCTLKKHPPRKSTEYSKMFKYCQSLASYKHLDMNSLPTGTSGIPNSWKVEDYNGE